MRKRVIQLALAGVLCVAPFVAAQNADQNTAGPSKNQLKLRLTEPREGAQISGSTIRVAVDYNRVIFGEGQGTKFGEKNFPMPLFDVYVDNTLKQTLKGGENNVAVIEGIPSGSHKIVVMAKNISNEVIDRAEVNVTNTAAAAASTDTSSSTTASSDYNRSTSAPSNPPEAAAPPSSSMPARPDTTTADTTTTRTSNSLPKTGSSAPDAAVLGLTLLVGGLWVARKGR